MSKTVFCLFLAAFLQAAQLSGPVSASDLALVLATREAHNTGLRDIMTYPKQSFVVSWEGAKLGTFLSLGARRTGASYQCLHTFVPTDGNVAPSSIVTAGAGKLGTDICDHPRAVGILPSSPDRIRIGVLYANSNYLDVSHTSGADAPSVSAALVIDPKTRKMALDQGATDTLQKAAPTTMQAMRYLF